MRNALFVVLGAGLWATDTLFRHPLVQEISPVTIVFYEHIFATLFAFVWVLSVARKKLWLGWREFLGAGFIGVFGSALATVLFTMSFQFVNPSVSILLQKIQPILVIIFSALFLGETLTGKFLLWAMLALASAFVISFPTGIHFDQLKSASTLGVVFAIFAAALWALSTVTGKLVLRKADENVLSFYRFLFGLVALYFISQRFDQSRIEIPFVLNEYQALRSILFMALIPGFLGVTLYYRGLRRVPASVATILELSFPLVAIGVNSYFLDLHLTQTQLFAGLMLLISMVGVSLSSKN